MMKEKELPEDAVKVEYLQWTGENFDEVSNFTEQFCGNKVAYEDAEERALKTGEMYIDTAHGHDVLNVGDYVTKDENGNIEICRKENFKFDEPVIEEKHLDEPVIEEKKDVTLGEKMVRTVFNPSQSDDVSLIKQKTAELINLCEGLKAKDERLASLAQTAYEEAAMWAVKAATA